MNKKIILPLLALTVAIGASTAIIKTVSAADSGTQHASIVQKLAAKFGLQENDVEAVFDENRAEIQKEHEQAFDERLNQAVADGKITAAQRGAILVKHTEMQQMREVEREVHQQKRAEFTQRTEANNIDPSFLFGQMRDEDPHMQRMNGGMCILTKNPSVRRGFFLIC